MMKLNIRRGPINSSLPDQKSEGRQNRFAATVQPGFFARQQDRSGRSRNRLFRVAEIDRDEERFAFRLASEGEQLIRRVVVDPDGPPFGQRGMGTPELDQLFQERHAALPGGSDGVRPVHHQVLPEETVAENAVPPRIGDLLPVVEKRYAVEREGERERRLDLLRRNKRLQPFFVLVVGDIVVVEAAQETGTGNRLRRFLLPIAPDRRRILSSGENAAQGAERTAVAHFKRGPLFRRLGGKGFGEHDQIRLERIDPAAPLLPEIERNRPGDVAAVAVHVEVADEVFHVFPQVLPQRRGFEVEFGEVPMPVLHRTVRLADHEVGMFVEEHRRRTAVIVDQIEDHPQPEFVRFRNERFEIVVGAVFGIDGVIIADPVDVFRILQLRLLLPVAPELPARVVVGQRHRAEVDDVRPERSDVRKQPLRRLQCAVERERAQIDLVDDSILQISRSPFRRDFSHFLSFPVIDGWRFRGYSIPEQAQNGNGRSDHLFNQCDYCMKQSLIDLARRLPEPESYFRGREPEAGFRLPSSILLYWHDYPHERTIISTRYMLILPALPMEYRLNGRSIELNPGLALLVNPYLQRSVPAGRDRYDRLIVSFEAEEDQEYLPDEPLMEMNDCAEAAAERLTAAYLEGDTLRALFELVLLLRELSRRQIPRSEPPLSFPVRQVLNRINSELHRPLSIKQLAEETELSPGHLRKKFREDLGIPLGDYLAERRIAAAKRLLEETGDSVGAIAGQCGYDTIYAFCRFFRKRTGMSPTSWRKHGNFNDRNCS